MGRKLLFNNSINNSGGSSKWIIIPHTTSGVVIKFTERYIIDEPYTHHKDVALLRVKTVNGSSGTMTLNNYLAPNNVSANRESIKGSYAVGDYVYCKIYYEDDRTYMGFLNADGSEKGRNGFGTALEDYIEFYESSGSAEVSYLEFDGDTIPENFIDL